MSGIERHLTRAGGLRLQWRQAGAADATPLVLLHPSPRSSAMFEPWMRMLAPHCRVLAVDTPGYGGSDPLPAAPQSLADYLGPLHELLQSVAGPRFMLYGSATGAQLGIAYAKAHPAAVRHLLLDNAAHFDADERAAILAQYFPDLSPRDDASHLQTAWRMALQMAQFFPWYCADEAHRVSQRVPSAAEVHAGVVELLAAGPGWADAYRAAFEHERAEHVMALRVPTTVFRWRGSILLRHIDRLLSFELPPHVRTLDTAAELPARYADMTAHVSSLIDTPP